MRDAFEKVALDSWVGATYGWHRRVSVVYPGQAATASPVDTLLDETSFADDCALMAQHARVFVGDDVEIMRADRGRPGHGTALFSSAPKPVVYSTAAFRHVLYLADTIFRYHAHASQDELADQVARAYYRVVAEYLLYNGDVDAAVHYAVLSNAGPTWASFSDRMRQRRERGECLSDRRDVYVPLAYHGLAHEIGHHVSGDRLRRIQRMRASRPSYIRSTMKQVLGKITSVLDAQGPLGIMGSVFVEMVVKQHVDTIRTEIIADIASVELLWQFHCASNAQRGLPPPQYELFISHVIISLICLWETVLIGTVADADPSRLQQASPADLSNALISNVGIMVRVGAIMDTFLKGRWYLWRSGMVPFTRFRQTMRSAMPLLGSTSVMQQVFQAFHPTQFALRLSPADGLQTELDECVPDADLAAFVQLAGELGLHSAACDALATLCVAPRSTT